MTIRESCELRSLCESIKMNHVLRSCHSHEKKIIIVTQIRISTICCIPTMCQAVDCLLYIYPNIQGGGYNGTDKSGMKTLLPFKYFKP